MSKSRNVRSKYVNDVPEYVQRKLARESKRVRDERAAMRRALVREIREEV